MIVIKLGLDEYTLKGGEEEFEAFRQYFLKNKSQQVVRIPKDYTGDRIIYVCPDKVTSFYFAGGTDGRINTLGTETTGEGATSVKKGRGRPKKS